MPGQSIRTLYETHPCGSGHWARFGEGGANKSEHVNCVRIESCDGKNSPFAVALARHVTKPGLDLRKAFGYVRDDVLRSTGNRQEPYVYGSLGGDDVPLVPAKPVVTGPQADPDAAVRRAYELALQAGSVMLGKPSSRRILTASTRIWLRSN